MHDAEKRLYGKNGIDTEDSQENRIKCALFYVR